MNIGSINSSYSENKINFKGPMYFRRATQIYGIGGTSRLKQVKVKDLCIDSKGIVSIKRFTKDSHAEIGLFEVYENNPKSNETKKTLIKMADGDCYIIPCDTFSMFAAKASADRSFDRNQTGFVNCFDDKTGTFTFHQLVADFVNQKSLNKFPD